jgi:hypothetical protein
MNKKFSRYLKKPFEVHYGWDNIVKWRMLEFFSKNQKPKRFSEVELVCEDIGDMRNLSLLCDNNSGIELIFCILNLHRGVKPEWLRIIRENDMFADNRYIDRYSVNVQDGKINFASIKKEEWVNYYNFWNCGHFQLYSLDLSAAKPLCLVLDAKSKRIVINSDGFVLDDDLNATTERLFTPKELMDFAVTRWFLNPRHLSLHPVQAIHDWIKSVLTPEFPLDEGLQYHETPQEYPLDWAVSGTGNKRTLINSDVSVTPSANGETWWE